MPGLVQMSAAPAAEGQILSTPVDGMSTRVYAEPSANLDLLRSFAVSAVLAAHCSEMASDGRLSDLGRLGVLLFFVHTAFVLLKSLDRLHRDGTGGVARRFMVQRLFRIYPLYLAAIIVSLPLRILWVNGVLYKGGLGWVMANLLFAQNLMFLPSVSVPMWSLSYEMQMYVALPLVYLLALQREALTKLLLLSFISGAAAFGMLTFTRLPYDREHEPVTYFVPCFLGGAYAFVLSRCQLRAKIPFLGLPAMLAGFGLVFCFVPHLPFLQYLTCTVVGFTLPLFKELRWRPFTALCHAIATYSYGVYLWHWPLLWLCFRKLSGLSSAVQTALFFSLLVGLSLLSYHALESPFLRLGRRLTARG